MIFEALAAKLKSPATPIFASVHPMAEGQSISGAWKNAWADHLPDLYTDLYTVTLEFLRKCQESSLKWVKYHKVHILNLLP